MNTEKDNSLDTVRINIFVPREVKEWYQLTAKKHGTSMSSYMAIALREYMDQKKMMQFMDNPMFMELAKKAYGQK
jgi:hypothetical protein